MSNFMKPETSNKEFQLLRSPSDEESWVPSFAADAWPEDHERVETVTGKWFGRLSASGFMDATEWNGPFKSEAAAIYDLWNFYGNDDETFFEFIGEAKYIVEGTLELRGVRNELYGQAPEDFADNAKIWLATLGDSDIDNPNEDADLGEAYGFELVDKGRALELRQRFDLYRLAYERE